MKRKILNILIIILTLLVLVSCIEFKSNEDYASPTEYESTVIKTSELLSRTTVALRNNNDDDEKELVGSAVVIHRLKNPEETIITAVTTANIVKTYKTGLEVVTSKIGNYSSIKDYAINEKYNIAIIQFSSKALLTPAKVLSSESKAFNYDVGQTIISVGTNVDLNNFNSIKVGMISNDKLFYNDINEYAFMHDATHNPGDEGAGVFDLEGNLLGLNAYNYMERIAESDEYILGTTLAIPAKTIANLFINFNSINMSNKIIENKLIEEEIPVINYTSKFNIEEKHIDLNESLRNMTITVKIEDELASGLVYSKEVATNNYWVVTKSFKPEQRDVIEIYSATNEKLQIIDSYQIDEMYLSVHKVATPNTLEVYNSTAINEGKGFSIQEGQNLVMFGTPISTKYTQTFNRAILSKASYDEGIFLHNGNLNYGQKGGPIFNLEGHLVGFNVEKTNETKVLDSSLLAEGLGFAVDINYVAEAINLITTTSNGLEENFEFFALDEINPYDPNYVEEAKAINVVKSVVNKTVTIKTETGHGSGVIFKKEELRPGTYRYSVLTNNHVIQSVSDMEISIIFNDGNLEVMAQDYAGTLSHDVAVVRFISKVEHEIIESRVIEESIGINVKKGQTVIAIGTPNLIGLNGYVTVGNITSEATSYNGILKLHLNHNTAINPGNSGGPLFDLNGELIGINVSKTTYFSLNGVSVPAEGIGHSLNMNAISSIVNSYRDLDYRVVVRKPRLGITVMNLSNIEGNLETLPNTNEGVLIIGVDEKRDSYNKVFVNDVIKKINGVNITSIDQIAAQLAGKDFDEQVTIEVLRLVEGETLPFEVIVTLK